MKPAAVLAAVMDPAAARSRADLLGRARSKHLATALQGSFSSSAEQEFGPDRAGRGSRASWLDRDVWASSTLRVDRWQGVQIDQSTARVLVRGENRGTAWDGGGTATAWAQYKLLLHRDPTAPHGWRVVHERAASTAV